MKLLLLLWLSIVGCANSIFAQSPSENWHRISSEDEEQFGYANEKNEVMIPLGKYPVCFSDTFATYAIVLISGSGFVAIDKKETRLYSVFPFDNGPDYPVEGLFRITKNNKVGFASEKTGEIVVQPQFGFATPFEYGISRVCDSCYFLEEDEHTTVMWQNSNSYYVDKTGKKVSALHYNWFTKTVADKHVSELKSLLKQNKLTQKQYQNKSYYGAALSGYYQGNKLQIIESNDGGDSDGFHTMIYLKDSAIVRVEITNTRYHKEADGKYKSKMNTTQRIIVVPGEKNEITQTSNIPGSEAYTEKDYKQTCIEVESMMIELRNIPYIEKELKAEKSRH